MFRGQRLIKELLPKIDLFIEIRDSRAPISSFNPNVDDLIKLHNKKKIVLMNKFELCNQEKTNKIVEELNSLGVPCLKVSSKERKFDFQKILPFCQSLKQSKYQSTGIWMMLGGVPNVGKSNIINNMRVQSKKFRNNQVSRSNGKACLTTYATGFKVFEDPATFVVDTPGILIPNIESAEKALTLSLIGSIKPAIAGKDLIC